MRHHFHGCRHLRLLSLDARDISRSRHGAQSILEELCDAKGLAPCVGVLDCDVLAPRQKRDVLALRAGRALALGDEEASLLFEGVSDVRARELAELWESLAEERAEIVDENRRLTAEWTGALDIRDVAGRGEEAELAASGVSPHLDEHMRSFRLARLDAIDRALEAMRVGRYGDCARCAGPIDVARLRDAPDTLACAKCAREAVSEAEFLGREATVSRTR